MYVHVYLYLCMRMHYSSAFSQPATAPSSACEGSDVTLQCRLVFNGIIPHNSEWFRNGAVVRVGNDFIPNHNQILNSTTGVFTDLVITVVTLRMITLCTLVYLVLVIIALLSL